MNLDHGIPVYGFHVYEGTIKIPLITPRFRDLREIDYPTSHAQLKRLILDRSVEPQEYIFSDTSYWRQHKRRLSMIKGKYKYVYSNMDRSEQLYDLDWDPQEKVNLLIDGYLDLNRRSLYKLDEIYFYPHWDHAAEAYQDLHEKKGDVWRNMSKPDEIISVLKSFVKLSIKLIKSGRVGKRKPYGRFGARVSQQGYRP